MNLRKLKVASHFYVTVLSFILQSEANGYIQSLLGNLTGLWNPEVEDCTVSDLPRVGGRAEWDVGSSLPDQCTCDLLT